MEDIEKKEVESTGRAFDWQSTTEDVLKGVDLNGKTVVVTGANSGLGSETARAFAAHGARVIITVRSIQKAASVVKMVHDKTGKTIEVEELELDSIASIYAFADRIQARKVKIDYLINNAGVASCPFGRTVDGFEMQFGVNHLGHFLMTNLIAPSLVDGGRVVVLSSTGHRMSPIVFDDINYENRPYEKHGAYGQSKTANALFSVGLNKRLSSRGIEVFSVHPGAIQTPLNRHMTKEDFAIFDSMDLQYKSLEQGAATSVFAATAPELNGRGGAFLSDCSIAPIIEDEKIFDGVRNWAIDPQEAERLWIISEKMVGQSFAY